MSQGKVTALVAELEDEVDTLKEEVRRANKRADENADWWTKRDAEALEWEKTAGERGMQREVLGDALWATFDVIDRWERVPAEVVEVLDTLYVALTAPEQLERLTRSRQTLNEDVQAEMRARALEGLRDFTENLNASEVGQKFLAAREALERKRASPK